MPHATGKKVSRRHTTIIDAAEPVVRLLNRRPEVRSIRLGEITAGLKGGQARRIKITPIRGGLKVQVRGSASVQIIWVYTSAPHLTIKALESF